MKLVEAAKKEQVGDLLDRGQRVGDASRPQGVPDAVDLALEFAIANVARLTCDGDALESRPKLIRVSWRKRLYSAAASRIVEHVFECLDMQHSDCLVHRMRLYGKDSPHHCLP